MIEKINWFKTCIAKEYTDGEEKKGKLRMKGKGNEDIGGKRMKEREEEKRGRKRGQRR